MTRLILLASFLALLTGCPKKDAKTLEDLERERQIQELIEEEDEIFDLLPESEEEDDETSN